MTTMGRNSIKSGWGKRPDLVLVPQDVLSTLEELGITVVKLTYNEAWALCPGHLSRKGEYNNKPDKWSINIETGIHSCFSCGFSGSFTTLVQEVRGYGRDAAERWLRSNGARSRFRDGRGVSSGRQRSDEGLRERPVWNEARLALSVDPPIERLAHRRISAGSVSHYGIRWQDGEDPHWILPIRDPDTHQLWGWQEKSENGWTRNKPYGVSKGDTLFGIDVFDNPLVVVLESPLDCAVSYTAGVYGAVSTFGARITEAQLELLLDLGVPVIFGLDNDEAGINASIELKKRYLRSGYPIKFLNYSHIPDKKDIGTEGVTHKQIQQAVLSAHSLVSFRP